MSMQQILLSYGKGEDAGWVLMSNYITSTPASHSYYQASAQGVLKTYNGDKLYLAEVYADSNDVDAWKVGFKRVDLDGSNYTDLSQSRGLNLKSYYNNKRDVYFRGWDIDTNDDLFIALFASDGNGNNNYSGRHLEYCKYDTSANSISWRRHIQSGAVWNDQKPQANSTTDFCVFNNDTKARLETGQFYNYWTGGGNKYSHCTIDTSNGDPGDKCITTADPGNESTRLHMMWGPMGKWGNQSSSNKVLFGAGRFLPPNSEPAAVVGIWDGTSISDCVIRNDISPYYTTPSKARYLNDLISKKDGSVGYVSVGEYITVSGQTRNTASITRFDSSMNRTNYQQEKTLKWEGTHHLAVDDTGGSDDGCLYCVNRIIETMTLNGTSTDVYVPHLTKYDTSGNIDWILRIYRPNNPVGGSGVGMEGTYPNIQAQGVTVAQDGSPIVYGRCGFSNEPNNPNNNNNTDLYEWFTPFYIKLPADGSFTGTIGSAQHEKWTITAITNYTAVSQTDKWSSTSASTNTVSWSDNNSACSQAASNYGKTDKLLTF